MTARRTALVAAYADAIVAHLQKNPPLPPTGSPLEALEVYETALDLWYWEYNRLREAYRRAVEASRGQ